jgi:hypothetical protein
VANISSERAAAPSLPEQAASAPNAATASIPTNTQTIAVVLQPESKPTSWHDPAVLTPAVAFAVFVFSIWSTRRSLLLSVSNSEKQLTAGSANLEKQLQAAAINQEKQLQAAAAATERQLKAAQDAAEAKMAHDREEARKVRLMNARRDIYVEIMADYQKVQQFIGSLANEDAKFEQRALLSIMSASVNKLWIWGEVDTAYKMREFYAQVNEFYYAALARALALKKTRDFITGLSNYHMTLKAKADHIGEKLREVNSQQDHVKADADWLQLHNRLTREHAEAVRNEQQHMSLITEYSAVVSRKETDYLDFVIDRQTFLNNQVNLIMASARADVGLQGDTSKLDEQTHELGDRVRSAVQMYKELHQAELRDMGMLDDDD